MDAPHVPDLNPHPHLAPAFFLRAAKAILSWFLALSLTLVLLARAGAQDALPGAEQAPSDPAATEDAVSVDTIAAALNARIQDVRDVSATVRFVQVSERDGSRMEGEVHLAAIFPDLVRATWIKPDYLSGVIWIMDSENNMFTQYIPVSGEAARHPLDEALQDQAALPFATPRDLFTLPPQDRYELRIVEDDLTNPHLVKIQATSKEAGQAYYLVVDTDKWLVTQFQTLNAKGVVNFSAEARDIRINQSLQAADLRRLPAGVIERSYH